MDKTRRSVLGGMAVLPTLWSTLMAEDALPPAQQFRRVAPRINAAEQVLNIMEFEALAQQALPPAHFGYIATGADDDLTVVHNHEAFSHFEIRAHRFNDLSHLDLTRTVFGVRWSNPFYLSAVSAMRAFHPEAEIAVARAAHARSAQLMVSTGASSPIEDIVEAYGAPHWQQLYPTNDWAVTSAIVMHAERAGCSAIALTVDMQSVRNNETLKRAMQVDNRTCTDCHVGNSHDMWRKAPMFAGLDVSKVNRLTPLAQTLEFIDKLRAIVKGRLIIKGIVTGEDAAAAVDHGADGIIISNHGGRNEDTLRATIDCLPEVVAAVRGRVPVFIDGGIRRGTDIFKALALGATAVGIGRPQAWGLAAYGQPGVEAVLNIYQRELAAIMGQAGTPSVQSITSANVLRSAS